VAQKRSRGDKMAQKQPQQLFIFDKDGTICESRTGKKFINSVADQRLILDVAEKCAELREQGHLLAVASNQGGVAWGFMDHETARRIVMHAADLISAVDWEFCPHHPDATVEEITSETYRYCRRCQCRKPEPGMIFDLIMRWSSLNLTTFIGDRPEDQQAAEAAGVKFVWAWEFFGRGRP